MIAKGVMKIDEWDDCVLYSVGCGCGSDEHNTAIEIEYEEDVNTVFVNFYKRLYCSIYFGNYNWFQRLCKRIKFSWLMLAHGYIDVEESIILQDEEHMENLIEALIYGLEKVQSKRDANKN